MDVLPVRPPPPHRPRPAAPRGAPRAAAHAHAAHADHRAPAAHAATDAPPTPEELALIAQQAGFDQMMQARAEAQREANALRDLMMEQLKHDDQAMRSWIKLI
jgi:arsenate reductase-like glutaredoxin family protein